MTTPGREPIWKQRAVERSVKTATQRAAQRAQRFLDSAHEIIIEKGSTDFTVQEVVDRSHQSLRSFYLQFDGKHELLLALFEDALGQAADQIRAETADLNDPLDRLKTALQLLFGAFQPDSSARRPLSTELARQLLVSHPSRAIIAYAPLLALLRELMEEAGTAGLLRDGLDTQCVAAMTMQIVMTVAQNSVDAGEAPAYSLTADQVWDLCAHGFVAN